jgi:hypothetical protein
MIHNESVYVFIFWDQEGNISLRLIKHQAMKTYEGTEAFSRGNFPMVPTVQEAGRAPEPGWALWTREVLPALV